MIIPVYNAGPYVAAAVASALEQPEVREVLLIEDASTDDSLQVCQALEAAHEEVLLLRHPGGVNKGAGPSRNLGMLRASRDFVAFLDADDHFLPGRFEEERRIFGEHPDADGVYGAIGAHFHDPALQKRFATTYAVELTTVRYRVAPEKLFDAHIGLHPGIANLGHFSLDGLTLRRAALDRMPLRMREDLRLRQDTEFIMRSTYHLRLYPGHIDKPVSSRGLHGNNRVTNDPRRPWSKYLLYKALLEWARTERIGTERKAALAAKAAQYRLLWACAEQDRMAGTRIFLTTPALWRRLDMTYACIDLVLGPGTWVGRWLKRLVLGGHRLLWRLRGGVPPEVLASWTKLDPSIGRG